MTNAELELIRIYKEAQENLYKEIAEKTARGTSTRFKATMLQNVNKELATLQQKSIAWVEKQIPKEYMSAIDDAEFRLAQSYGEIKELGIKPFITVQSATGLHKRAINALVNEKIATLSIANRSLEKKITQAIKQKFATGQTLKELQKNIASAVFEDGGDKIVINNRNYDMRKYSETVARTATREATNTASMNVGKSVGSDVMKMSSHFPTCPICAPLQGRWYSTDPDNTKYPYIYDTAWASGYNTVHPNCRHTFTPVIMALEDSANIIKKTAYSNRPIEQSSQSQRQLNAYNADQKIKAKRWSDFQQYERYQTRLGKDNVPKTFSAFRNMKKSGNDNWSKLHKAYINS